MRMLILPISVSLLVFASPTLACSIPPPPPMTDQEKAAEAEKYRQAFLDRGRNAEAFVRVKALSSSGYGEGTALVKVLKTLHGKTRCGTIIRLKTIDSGMCGWGHLKRGEHGVIILDKARPRYFKGFLEDEEVREYRKAGILPPED